MTTATDPGVRAVWADGVPQPRMPYSPAVRAGDWLFVAGQLASDFAVGLPPALRPANPFLVSPLQLQGEYVLGNLAATVAAAGAEMGRDTVRLSRWFTGAEPVEQWPAVGVSDYLAAEQAFGFGASASSFGIAELMVSGTEVEIDVIARLDGATPEAVLDAAGATAGVRRGDWVFLSARAASPVGGWDPVDRQTSRLLDELDAIAGPDRAVRAEVFLRRPGDRPAFERAWRARFGDGGPARVVVTSTAPLDPRADVEIALTLLGADSALPFAVIDTPDAPPALGGVPQAVRAGDLLFLSEQLAFDGDGRLAVGTGRTAAFPWYGSPGRLQMDHVLDNVAAICAAGGTGLENIVRRVCFHDDLACFAESIAAWSQRFPGVKPASTTLRVGGSLGVPGATTLLDLIAYVGPETDSPEGTPAA
jgi:enamine deaminase RidA (YjgF/YER057c/UK114 family)